MVGILVVLAPQASSASLVTPGTSLDQWVAAQFSWVLVGSSGTPAPSRCPFLPGDVFDKVMYKVLFQGQKWSSVNFLL